MDDHIIRQFGSHLFDEGVMKERLPKQIFHHWSTACNKKEALDKPTADAIAHAMKTWALELDATHFCHWFHPMTGATAEKHEAFLERGEDGKAIAAFSGNALIKGEPDASSFPNGGLRTTFAARGYTYWDCTSPVFVRNQVLCIPTIFVSYTGESLDKKAPLLKSIDAISKHATRVLNLLGNKEIMHVMPMVGIEQEYFLIDRNYFLKRKDLMLCGRTLFGAMPAKGQELEEHYFGAIPNRVVRFMKDVNRKLWMLGIYAKAEHNEAAPGQFELAPLFAPCNVAVDQNYLIMDVLRSTALEHDLICLLHEKPFSGINGSGKHNNWSLITDQGQNLFEPGDNPQQNLSFLLFLCAVIEAVDTYPELLRMAASSAGNDHRLGTSEAPPAIVSIDLGHIETVLLQLEDETLLPQEINWNSKQALTNISNLPKDLSDRNRTSPFAFTGNKFEFRMVGSSRSSATANIILNTIVADSLEKMAIQMMTPRNELSMKEAALSLCKQIIKQHKRILFRGNGYSAAWLKEAKTRGLPNIPTFVESIHYYATPEAISLFDRQHVYTQREILARCAILYEYYARTIKIEATTLTSMMGKQIIPMILQELKDYTLVSSQHILSNEFIEQRMYALSKAISDVDGLKHDLESSFALAWNHQDYKEKGLAIVLNVVPKMKLIRTTLEAIEAIISEKNWTIPTYEQLFFQLDFDN